MIIDSSGKGRKVWKSEVISPAVIVATVAAGHMWVHSESIARVANKQITRKFVLFENLITWLGS